MIESSRGVLCSDGSLHGAAEKAGGPAQSAHETLEGVDETAEVAGVTEDEAG